jgi:hypothetical protein
MSCAFDHCSGVRSWAHEYHRSLKEPRMIYKNKESLNEMKVVLDNYEKEILIETIEFRLENDDRLVLDDRMRDDIKDILEKVEDEYV